MSELLNILIATTNEDATVREQAERALINFAQESGYGVGLSQIFVNTQIPEHIRQLAGLILKRYVRHHWEPTDKGQFRIASEEEKNEIKKLLPQVLQSPEVKLRTAAAMAIASIAHWDWPAKWPDLINSLLDCLGSPDPNLVEGAICCLEMFASGENLSEQHLPGLITLAFPPLLHIVAKGGDKFSDRVKMRATMVVQACLHWLSITKQVATATRIESLGPMLPHWLAAFYHHLEIPDKPHQFKGFKISILQAILVLIHDFPGQLKKQLTQLMEPIWKSLINCYPMFEEFGIKNNRLDECNLRSTESPSVFGLEPFVAILFDVFHALANKIKFRPLLQTHLDQLFYLTIGYMQMTEEQIEQYAADPNEWVADEEDDTLENSVRISTSALLQELFKAYKLDAYQPFSSAVTKRLNESEEALKKGEKHWWKLREASVFAIGTVADSLLKHSEIFDLKGFASTVLLSDIHPNQLPFVRGRALWCASMIGKGLNMDQLTPFLKAASESLNSPKEHLPVKIFACRAVGNFCPRLQPQLVSPYLAGLMNGLVTIMDVVSKDTLYLLLETFHILLPLSEEVTRNYLLAIVTRLCVLWAHNYKDHMMEQHLLEIISDIAQFQSCNYILQERLTQTLVNLLKQQQKHQFRVIETTIDLAAAIIMPARWPIHPQFINEFFPLLCELLLSTQESTILESGANALRAFVRVSGLHLLNINNGLDNVIKVIARQLAPGIPENASLNVGFLIDKVIVLYRDQLSSILDQILTAVLEKLHTVSSSSLQQGLLMVFVRLFVTNPDQAISYLLTKNFNGKTELEFILRQWTEQHSDFRGGFKIKMSILGLSKLFQCSHPALSRLTVPGDIVISQETGRKTRSKARQQKEIFAEEPLKLRIIKMLIREHQVIKENEGSDSISLSDSAEEADWGSSDDEDAFTAQLIKAVQGKGMDPSIIENLDPFEAQETVHYLDEILSEGGGGLREENEDPDIKLDPIYQIDLKSYITQFLKAFAEQDSNAFMQYVNLLPPLDIKHLQTNIFE